MRHPVADAEFEVVELPRRVQGRRGTFWHLMARSVERDRVTIVFLETTGAVIEASDVKLGERVGLWGVFDSESHGREGEEVEHTAHVVFATAVGRRS